MAKHRAEEHVMYAVTSVNNRRGIVGSVLWGSTPGSLLCDCAINITLQQRINKQQKRKLCFLWIRPEAI
jgi:hypothetical protein